MPERGAILADTSLWIEALRPHKKLSWLAEFTALVLEGRVFTLPVIRLELLSGSRDDAEFRDLEERLDALPCIVLDDRVWQEASRLAYRLRRRGVTVPNTDILIASAALVQGCPIWHRDKHFTLIASHSPLVAKGG